MSEPVKKHEAALPTLDDGPPRERVSPRRLFGGLFAIIAALIAVPILLLGFAWLVYAFIGEQHRYDRPESFMKAGVLIGIGLVCAIASWRWNRAAFR